MRLITLLSLILTPFIAQADIFEYPLKEVRTLVVCAYEVPCSRAMNIFRKSAAYIEKSVNVRLKVVAVLELVEEMTGDPERRVLKWQERTAQARERLNAGATVVFVEPYPLLNDIDFEAEQVYGVANGIGTLGNRDSLTWIKMAGSDRMISRIAVHEIGHLMGAWHTNGIGIMGQYTQQIQHSDAYAPYSIEQIKQYVSQLP